MRAPRDLLRRRPHLRRTRAALLAHVHHTTSPYTLPERGTKIAYQANRDGVAARCADPAVPKRIAVDLALLTSDDHQRYAVSHSLVQAATAPHAPTLPPLPTVAVTGTRDSLVLLVAQ